MTEATAEAAVDPGELSAARPNAWRRLAANGLTVFGLALVAAIVLVSLAAPVLPLTDPNVTETASRLQPPLWSQQQMPPSRPTWPRTWPRTWPQTRQRRPQRLLL